MAQARHHYERAFEAYLRTRRIPYVAVHEARKTLLPAPLSGMEAVGSQAGGALKSFDFVAYGPEGNLLVDVKGRRLAERRVSAEEGVRTGAGGSEADGVVGMDAFDAAHLRRPAAGRERSAGGPGIGRLESWVTEEDVSGLRAWQGLFGAGFRGAFVFAYWCDSQPPDGLFQEIFAFEGRWYGLRFVLVDEYAVVMKPRSPKWRTVHLAGRDFERLSRWPGLVPGGGKGSGGGKGVERGSAAATGLPLS